MARAGGRVFAGRGFERGLARACAPPREGVWRRQALRKQKKEGARTAFSAAKGCCRRVLEMGMQQ